MEWTAKDALQLGIFVFAAGAFVQQSRATGKSTDALETRLRAVERVANDTALLLKTAGDTLARVVGRLDQHEKDAATIDERVNNHGLEIDRLRNERCS